MRKIFYVSQTDHKKIITTYSTSAGFSRAAKFRNLGSHQNLSHVLPFLGPFLGENVMN